MSRFDFILDLVLVILGLAVLVGTVGEIRTRLALDVMESMPLPADVRVAP